MAHKKRKKHHGHRVGGVNFKSRGMISIASVAVGYLMADTINAQIDKMLPASMTTPAPAGTTSSITNYVPVIGELGIGAALIAFKKTGMIGAVAGGLLAGAGIKRALKQVGAISGYQSVPVIGSRNRRMAGYQSTPVIAGIPGQLSGTPSQLSGGGYRSGGSGVSGEFGYQSNGSGISSGTGYMQ